MRETEDGRGACKPWALGRWRPTPNSETFLCNLPLQTPGLLGHVLIWRRWHPFCSIALPASGFSNFSFGRRTHPLGYVFMVPEFWDLDFGLLGKTET